MHRVTLKGLKVSLATLEITAEEVQVQHGEPPCPAGQQPPEPPHRPANPIYRFRAEEVNNDNEWFRGVQGRLVAVCKTTADGMAAGYFIDDGTPFDNIGMHRLEYAGGPHDGP